MADFAIAGISRTALTEESLVEGDASSKFVTERWIVAARGFDGRTVANPVAFVTGNAVAGIVVGFRVVKAVGKSVAMIHVQAAGRVDSDARFAIASVAVVAPANVGSRTDIQDAMSFLVANVGKLTGCRAAVIPVSMETGFAFTLILIEFIDQTFRVQVAVIGDVARQANAGRGAAALITIAVESPVTSAAVSPGMSVIGTSRIGVAISQHGAIIGQWSAVLPVSREAPFASAMRMSEAFVIHFHRAKCRPFIAL